MVGLGLSFAVLGIGLLLPLRGGCSQGGRAGPDSGKAATAVAPQLLAQNTQAAAPATGVASGQKTQLGARSGSTMRIEGTSSLHDWQMESHLIGGMLEVGPNFPLEPGKTVEPANVEVSGQAYVTVTSFKSIEKDGTKYSDKMDEIMYEHLDYTNHPKIIFKITDLVLKEAPKDNASPYVFDSKGELALAGVTNKVSFPVNITPLGDKKFKITGSFPTKMSDFKVKPESIGLGIVKTGDDVKLIWTWIIAVNPPKPAPPK